MAPDAKRTTSRHEVQRSPGREPDSRPGGLDEPCSRGTYSRRMDSGSLSRAFFDAFRRRDLDAMFSMMAEDVRYEMPGSPTVTRRDRLPRSGTHQQTPAVRAPCRSVACRGNRGGRQGRRCRSGGSPAWSVCRASPSGAAARRSCRCGLRPAACGRGESPLVVMPVPPDSVVELDRDNAVARVPVPQRVRGWPEGVGVGGTERSAGADPNRIHGPRVCCGSSRTGERLISEAARCSGTPFEEPRRRAGLGEWCLRGANPVRGSPGAHRTRSRCQRRHVGPFRQRRVSRSGRCRCSRR